MPSRTSRGSAEKSLQLSGGEDVAGVAGSVRVSRFVIIRFQPASTDYRTAGVAWLDQPASKEDYLRYGGFGTVYLLQCSASSLRFISNRLDEAKYQKFGSGTDPITSIVSVLKMKNSK